MYIFKGNINLEEELKGRSQRYLAKKVGITEVTISLIFSRKRTTSKPTAYYITKMLDMDKEIEDYFDRF